jgi:dihydroxy-acid dehydratase
VREGDTVTFDLENRRLDVALSEAELRDRLAGWTPPAPRAPAGVLGKYARLVSSASGGAVTSAWNDPERKA